MAQNKRILVVDDQQDLREQMAKLLSRSTRDTETASLVKQMRSRIGGASLQGDDDSDSEPERGNYEVDTASQGQEALEKVRKALEEKRPYAAMFLDMRMPPGWDGMETAKRIRQVDKLIEVVIMTAYADHDQETIAKSVGAPDKLLYIKKPFQAEEIFQLALCLSSKWSAEEDERLRRQWLESLLRSISRIKAVKPDAGKLGESAFSSVMKALLLFTGVQKGFIASHSNDKWSVESASGMELAEAEAFIHDHEAKINSCGTPLQMENKYLLPLRRDGSSALAVLCDMAAPGDPEWFKLLNLLSMTASEALHNASTQEATRRKERQKALEDAAAKIAAACLPKAKALAASSSLKPEARDLLASLSLLKDFGSPHEAEPPRRMQLVEMLQLACDELKLEAQAGLEIETEVSGLSSAEAFSPENSLLSAIKIIASSRAAAASKAGLKVFQLKICVKPDASALKIDIQDNAPGILDAQLDSAFEPFALDEGFDGFSLALPMAKRILSAAKIALKLELTASGGMRFSICVPAAPKP